ncbi:hypothetical protein AAHA92_23775 [Salvia divinorum]|uniref:Uncharacterized protein n=1 Tax=Salvia divinorum TaxID=28513 RepID=A0ABD1GTF9_SALDI
MGVKQNIFDYYSETLTRCIHPPHLLYICKNTSSSFMPAQKQHCASPYDVKPSLVFPHLLRATLDRPLLQAPRLEDCVCGHVCV